MQAALCDGVGLNHEDEPGAQCRWQLVGSACGGRGRRDGLDGEDDCGAAADVAFGANLAPNQGAKTLADREAEARAAVFACGRGIHLRGTPELIHS